MSETEEPPAKVLKIDGTESLNNSVEMSLLETSRGHEEVHEEWLSEGILTDDDYNTASQEDDDRTDSQAGSQEDNEEHLDTSMESNHEKQFQNDIQNVLDDLHKNIEDTAENVPENQAESESMQETQNGQEIDNAAEVAQSEQEMLHSEQEVEQNETGIARSEQEIARSEQEIVRNELEIVLNASETANEQGSGHKPQLLENLLITLANDGNNDSVVSTTAVLLDTQMKIHSSHIARKNSNFESDVKSKTVEQNIEETMKHLDGSKYDANSDDIEDLLLKESNTKTNGAKVEAEAKKEDDGNDTDDLLRMLGEDDNKTKKLTKTVKDLRRGKQGGDSSDDDDFVYEGPGVKKLRAVKSAISKKLPTKAEPEDFDDYDYSSDHSDDTLKRMFKSNFVTNKNAKNTSNIKPKKHMLNIVEKPAYAREKPTVKQYHNKQTKFSKSILKPSLASSKTVQANNNGKMEVKKGHKISFKSPSVTAPAPFKSNYTSVKEIHENDDFDEEFLDDDEFNLDDDNIMETEAEEIVKSRQRIMRPEIMDEDVPSDADSFTEGSFYDELPSSGSEDMDDWFTLDIRAEKAGDYLPLLGSKAKQLLLEEKERVSTRLQSLKQNLSALTDSGKQQAEELRNATMTLAQMDDMIKAS